MSQGFITFTPQPDYVVDQNILALIAQCQRYYCLAHAAFTTGILIGMDYAEKPVWRVSAKSYSALLLRLSLGVTILAFITSALPGMTQFAIKLKELSFVAAVLSFGLSYS